MAVGSAKAVAAEQLGSYRPKPDNQRGARAVVSAEAEVAEKRGPYRPKANKQRGHDGRRIRLKSRLRCTWGRIGRRLTSSEFTKAVE